MTESGSRSSRRNEDSEDPSARSHRPLILVGIAGSPGIAIGPAALMGGTQAPVAKRELGDDEIEAEWARFTEAVSRAQESIRSVAERMKASGTAEASILETYVAMLGDEMIAKGVARQIREAKHNVEWAVESTIREIGEKIAGSSDPYLVERRHDIAFIGERLLRALAGTEELSTLPSFSRPSIIVASDLSPADTAAMAKEPVLAIVTESGTRTSHTSIMARALEIPGVVGVVDALSTISAGETVIVDGFRGEITISPTPEMIAAAMERAARHTAFLEQLRVDRNRQATTADGAVVHLRANIELPAELALALEHGAEGIGLYRTELLYLDRAAPPSEDEQFEIYRAIVEASSPRPVTLRTFDIGGDKFASSFPVPEERNPALGLRAIRLALSRPDVFLEQLRAMVRASAFGDLRILLPMIATLNELREARKLLERAMFEVLQRGEPHAARIPLGIMVEVPSAAILADLFAREADFLSLGTNDLAQYTLATDRTSRALAYLASPFDPALLHLIAKVARAARQHEKPVSLCGAMASEPLAAVLLVGLGLRDLSMEAAALPEIKEALRRVRLDEAEALANEALSKGTANEVEQLVREALREKLGDWLTGEAESS